jgi:Zn-dependent M32 family carboxypeptidase
LQFQICYQILMEEHTLKDVNSCWNTKFSFYLETSGGQNSNQYLNGVHFFQYNENLTSVAA